MERAPNLAVKHHELADVLFREAQTEMEEYERLDKISTNGQQRQQQQPAKKKVRVSLIPELVSDPKALNQIASEFAAFIHE